jgi:hypothetical protein
MTLGTNSFDRAIFLIDQLNVTEPFDLSGNKGLLKFPLPKILWSHEMSHPRDLPSSVQNVHDFTFKAYSSVLTAQKFNPHIKNVLVAWPHHIHQLILNSGKEVILDLGELGAAVLGDSLDKNEGEPGIHHIHIFECLNYLFSPEIWGNDRKWPRFHSEFLDLLTSRQLLIRSDGPGHYETNPALKIIENYGVKGLSENNCYKIQMPWTFSLTSFNKLKSLIVREF